MLLRINTNGTILCKSVMLITFVFAINGCSSVDISYISRDVMKSSAFAGEKPRYAVGDSKPMQLGALRMTNTDAKEGEAGRILILQRKKGVYMAETKLDIDSKRRYFFSIGINPRNKTPAIGFRMEF